ncbi:beta-ketoacyl-ACP synthase I [Methylomonas sp. AM2-LC]|uniref:beta-ketoacyl-ACP synthase I n=1 Tax=Methylomonas sp. AM2-LC TaxID=3153301 RepID=UPI003267CBE2
MKRVVVTGLGIVSSIGNDRTEVVESLKSGRSGICHADIYEELGFRSHVHGPINLDIDALIDRKIKRFMGDGAAYNYIAMQQAIIDAGLEDDEVSNYRTGLVMGSGGPSTSNLVDAADILRSKGVKKVGPYMVTRAMSSTNTACLATPFKIKGVNYTISSACATSAHCIGHAMELIQLNKQDIVFAGGGEELHWTMSVLFDAMGALSSKYNDSPETASRPYDSNRDGFVISGGGGVLVIEELEHAKARGAKIYAELVGYGATSDGYDMVQPSGEGAVRCMQQAMASIHEKIDYINAHGTSTPVGDTRELEALRNVFGSGHVPAVSSTKSLTGHALGAAGVNEAIYSLLMMQENFLSASANITDLDPDAADIPIIRDYQSPVSLNTVMSNSFGFGGTNATLIFQRYNG